MKVLFAVNNEKIAESITRKYQEEYKEIISSKTVYYYNAIIKELQKDKTYDRIVIGEDLEPFANENYQAIDKYIFEKMDAISDEATNVEGDNIPIILIGLDRRTKNDPLLLKLFGLGLYDVLVGQDRSIQKVVSLMYKPRSKKEAKAYYKVETENVKYETEKSNAVSENEIQNILTHYKKIGNNIPKCVQSFESINSQYSKEQIKVIIEVLPVSVKVILEENSDTYRKIMGIKGKKVAGTSVLREKDYVEKQINTGSKLTKPVIIPTTVSTKNVMKVKKENNKLLEQKNNNEKIAKEKAAAEAKRKEEKIAKEKAMAEAKRKEQEKIAKEKATAEAKKKEEEKMAKKRNTTKTSKIEVEDVVEPVKRGRGRPRKTPIVVEEEVVPIKRKRGRPRKNETIIKENEDIETTDEDILINNNEIDLINDDYGIKNNIEIEENEDDLLPGFEEYEEDIENVEDVEDSDEIEDLDFELFDDETFEIDDTEEYEDEFEEDEDIDYLLDEEDDEPEVFEDEENIDDDFDFLDEEEQNELPGFEDIEDEQEIDELIGFEDEDEVEELPGFEDEDEVEELPGFEDEDEVEELPGFEDEDEVDELIGFEDEDEVDELIGFENEDEIEELPGFEDENEVDELPGFEDEDEIDELPGVENEDNVEEVITLKQHNGSFGGINNRNYKYDNNLANSIKDLKETETVESYNIDTDNLITGNQKIVSFVGTTKNGTSFIVNNLAELLSNKGIKTAILDLTKNKNSYYIYTNNEEELRQKAQNSFEKLIQGIADGVVINRNLSVFTSLPGEDESLDNVTNIVQTLLENFTVVLMDCDFGTDPRYFKAAQEIYLVQSLDILTIQPLTAFLRDLKVKGILEPYKLRIVINKDIKVNSINDRILIGGMSVYNDPAMTYMTELFDKETIKYTSIPFESQVYVKYLEGLINCKISSKGYSKNFMVSLNNLSDMVYPTLNGKKTKKYNDYLNNNKRYENTFSKNTSSTLDKMRKNY